MGLVFCGINPATFHTLQGQVTTILPPWNLLKDMLVTTYTHRTYEYRPQWNEVIYSTSLHYKHQWGGCFVTLKLLSGGMSGLNTDYVYSWMEFILPTDEQDYRDFASSNTR